jgi:hypothetical protein
VEGGTLLRYVRRAKPGEFGRVPFNNTSFAMERRDNKLTAFLIGFLPLAKTKEGCTYFAGVHPEYCGIGLEAYL